jgi:hypothetical protein
MVRVPSIPQKLHPYNYGDEAFFFYVILYWHHPAPNGIIQRQIDGSAFTRNFLWVKQKNALLFGISSIIVTIFIVRLNLR